VTPGGWSIFSCRALHENVQNRCQTADDLEKGSYAGDLVTQEGRDTSPLPVWILHVSLEHQNKIEPGRVLVPDRKLQTPIRGDGGGVPLFHLTLKGSFRGIIVSLESCILIGSNP